MTKKNLSMSEMPGKESFNKINYLSKSKKFRGGIKVNNLKDLSKYTRWPRAISLQKQRRIFSQKLKLPGPLEFFSSSLDKNMTREVFNLIRNYKDRNPLKKKNNLKSLDKNSDSISIIHGTNAVAKAISKKKVFFVIIAQDVNPIECVVWLAPYCVKMNVPFCIIKNKSKLGQLIGRKRVSCLAINLKDVARKEEMEKMRNSFNLTFNKSYKQAKEKWNFV